MDLIIKKIVLVGDPGVGKTSIHKRYMGKGYDTTYLPTLGADFSHIKINRDDFPNKSLNFSIWDIAGQPNYDSVRSVFYNGADAAIVIYDISREHTLESVDVWMEDLKRNLGKVIPMIMVGNKEDLRNDEELVVIEDQIADKHHELLESKYDVTLPRFSTSAKTGRNIDKVFDHLSDMLFLD